eukprot:TRINITY_DN1821_c0_g2_i1.p2 TRINITY_DN1821_c0_g2~~TRINITY_DN1821_c0_g2_i1.p2  ORF type:complete len:149 (+),score=59.69 TRINITY_DN1821_c0_g2_i1:51-497(+)
MELREFTAAEVADRAASSDGDAWLIIFGKVFCVKADYLDSHPGGPDILQSMSGKDAGAQWEDVKHSARARRKMKEFLVGRVSGYVPERPVQGEHTPTDPEYLSQEEAMWRDREQSTGRGNLPMVMIAVVAVAAVVLVYFQGELAALAA